MDTLQKRFWAKVKKTDGCWLWTAAQNEAGYNVLGKGGRRAGNYRATWVAVYLHTGEWPPKGMYVCHHCDNRACVRPDHIYVGTPKQNVADMWARRRNRGNFTPDVVGSAHNKAKLTESEVIEMRNLFAAGGVSQMDLSRQYGVSQCTISSIVNRKTWKHV